MAVYANENGFIKTLATDGEPLNILYKQYTAEIIPNNSTVSGTRTAEQTFTLQFTPKIIIGEATVVPTTRNDNFMLGLSINIRGTTQSGSNMYSCTLEVNGSIVIIAKVDGTKFGPPQETLIFKFDLIFSIKQNLPTGKALCTYYVSLNIRYSEK